MTDELMTSQPEQSAPQAAPEAQAPVSHDEGRSSDTKTFHQHEINDIARKAREAGYQKAKREAESSYQSPPAPVSSLGGMPQYTPEHIQKMVADETQRYLGQAQQMAQAETTVRSFVNKMSLGMNNYSDFEQTVNKISLTKVPEVVSLAAGVDNTADVMYELAKNPLKLSQLHALSKDHPQLAQDEMNRLSQAIKTNREGAATYQSNVNPPLSQINPSPNGVGTGSTSSTVSSLRRNPKLRA